MSMESVLARGALWLAAKAMLMMLTGFAQPVQAFIDPPYLTPEHPIAGEEVSVNIRFGICDAIIDLPTWPRITRTGNAIRVVLWSSTDSDPIWCNVPIGTASYVIGIYPPGSYTLRVDRDYFGDLGGLLTETLGVLPFTVTAPPPPPVAVPTLSRFGLATLVAVLVGLIAWRKRRVNLLFIAALMLPLSARAQVADPPPNRTLEVLLTTAPGAPTAQQLVDYYARPTGTSPLSALSATSPLVVQYLLPLRAEGDFLARLEANPNSARAKLEPPRVLRRLQPLRGWSHEDDSNTLLPGAARACGADGAGAPGRSRISVGGDCLDRRQGGLHARVAAPLGAPGRA